MQEYSYFEVFSLTLFQAGFIMVSIEFLQEFTVPHGNIRTRFVVICSHFS